MLGIFCDWSFFQTKNIPISFSTQYLCVEIRFVRVHIFNAIINTNCIFFLSFSFCTRCDHLDNIMWGLGTLPEGKHCHFSRNRTKMDHNPKIISRFNCLWHRFSGSCVCCVCSWPWLFRISKFRIALSNR